MMVVVRLNWWQLARNYALVLIMHNPLHPSVKNKNRLFLSANSPFNDAHLELDLPIHLAWIMACDAWMDIKSVCIVHNAHFQLAK